MRALARRHGISTTTVQNWRKRATTIDARRGPKQVSSSVLTLEQEAMIVALRRHTLLPLDDCLYALQASVVHGSGGGAEAQGDVGDHPPKLRMPLLPFKLNQDRRHHIPRQQRKVGSPHRLLKTAR